MECTSLILNLRFPTLGPKVAYQTYSRTGIFYYRSLGFQVKLSRSGTFLERVDVLSNSRKHSLIRSPRTIRCFAL